MQPDTDQLLNPIKKMELLAPAGDFEALKAAVENGADAVYLGGKLFNARASAANFTTEELKKAIAYAHERLVKIYVTVNILVADQEFPLLADYLYELYTMGVDAVIVQDIGVACFIREVLPEIELHASTQMTQTNSYGIRQLEKMGFSRVVLARETIQAEMAKIIQATNMEIEVFGHGALCISYSGQCLMSSYIGARSGNRGRCAQPCRMAYQLVDSKGNDLLGGQKLGEHLLSPRDLNLSEELVELQKTGVSSLKIEGRMKRPEYVATVVRIYRKALDDLALKNRQGLTDQDRYELTQIFNRDFTTGYFHGYQGAEMMSFARPNNRGAKAGRILEVRPNRLTLKLESGLNIGDGLEIWTSRGREGITIGKIFDGAGRSVAKAAGGETVSIEFTGSARAGDRVFKTHDQELMEKARLSFQEGKEQRKRPLKMRLSGSTGSKLRLEAWENSKYVVVESSAEAQEAVNRPLEHEYLAKQLGRLGNTPFYLEDLELDLKGKLIVPVSEINDLRRQIVEKLLEPVRKLPQLDKNLFRERLNHWHNLIQNQETYKQNTKQNTKQSDPKKYQRTLDKSSAVTAKAEGGSKQFTLSAALTDDKMIASVLKAGADRIILGGESWRSRPLITLSKLEEIVTSCASRGAELVWRLPRILNEGQSQRVFRDLREIAQWQTRPVIMTGNLAGIEMVKALDPTWPWETDHFFHIFNQAALLWVQRAGGKRAALSTELNHEQIKQLNKLLPVEMIVFGDMEMMVSEYCLIGSTLGQGKGGAREKCGKACEVREYFLKDRLSYNFPLETDRNCRMHIFNAKRLNLITELGKIAEAGIYNIRLELHRVSPAQAQNTVGVFKRLWTEAGAGKTIKPEKTEEAVQQLESLYPEGFTKGHFYRGVLD